MRPHDFHEGAGAFPIFGSVLLMIIVLAGLAAFVLWRKGKLTLPTLPGFGPALSAEDAARRILAERFARGDIDPDDFMERASVLNWTPGSDSLPARRPPTTLTAVGNPNGAREVCGVRATGPYRWRGWRVSRRAVARSSTAPGT